MQSHLACRTTVEEKHKQKWAFTEGDTLSRLPHLILIIFPCVDSGSAAEAQNTGVKSEKH